MLLRQICKLWLIILQALNIPWQSASAQITIHPDPDLPLNRRSRRNQLAIQMVPESLAGPLDWRILHHSHQASCQAATREEALVVAGECL